MWESAAIKCKFKFYHIVIAAFMINVGFICSFQLRLCVCVVFVAIFSIYFTSFYNKFVRSFVFFSVSLVSYFWLTYLTIFCLPFLVVHLLRDAYKTFAQNGICFNLNRHNNQRLLHLEQIATSNWAFFTPRTQNKEIERKFTFLKFHCNMSALHRKKEKRMNPLQKPTVSTNRKNKKKIKFFTLSFFNTTICWIIFFSSSFSSWFHLDIVFFYIWFRVWNSINENVI